jgi:hypothetical protein
MPNFAEIKQFILCRQKATKTINKGERMQTTNMVSIGAEQYIAQCLATGRAIRF